MIDSGGPFCRIEIVASNIIGFSIDDPGKEGKYVDANVQRGRNIVSV